MSMADAYTEASNERYRLEAENGKLRAEVEKLSKGLYERIQNRSRYINLSAVDTALDHIDFINLQNSELREHIERIGGEVPERLMPADMRYHEGDGHVCIASEGIPCSLCGRVAKRSDPVQKKICGMWVPAMGPCIAEVPCKAHPDKKD
jgi:hypothetical protein